MPPTRAHDSRQRRPKRPVRPYRILVADRPYLLIFHATGAAYPATSEEVRRLLDNYPPVRVLANRLILPGHNTADPKQRVTIRPATLGGGPAFTREEIPS